MRHDCRGGQVVKGIEQLWKLDVRRVGDSGFVAGQRSFGTERFRTGFELGRTRAGDLRMSAEVRTARAVFTATTRDLSEGGAGLNCDRPLDEGEEVTIGLFLVLDDVEADTPPLWVKGRVAWARSGQNHAYAAGVSFEVITEEQRTWLRQVLREIGGGAAGPT